MQAVRLTCGTYAEPYLYGYAGGDISEMDEVGYEDCFYGEGVTLIEWSNMIEEILPEHVKTVTIEKNLEKGFDYRKITVEDK